MSAPVSATAGQSAPARTFQPKRLGRGYLFAKRTGDVLLSLVGLVVLSPVLAATALAVRFTSRGPIIFRQTRAGRNLEPFTIYKFRTMHAESARQGDDPSARRITSVGRWLRRLSVDELPQLANVVKGDMSLVGPRPVIPCERDLLEARERWGANDIRPGLTGFAQVSGRDLIGPEEKARLDGVYRAKMSATYDLRCLTATVGAVLRGDGFDDNAHLGDERCGDEAGCLSCEEARHKTRVLVASSSARQLLAIRLNFMSTLEDAGYEVHAAAPDDLGGAGELYAREGIAFHDLKVSNQGVNPFADLKTFSSFKRLYRTVAPSVVLLNHAKPVVYGAPMARRLGTERVYVLVSGLGTGMRGSSPKALLARTVLVPGYRAAFAASDRALFHNPDDAALCVRRNMLSADKTAVVDGSGVNLERFVPEPLPETPSFLFLARFLRDKGLMEYLDAAARVKEAHPEARCIVAGFSDANPSALPYDHVQELADAGGLEFAGAHKDVRPLLAACSVFVLPSYHEGLPRGVLEAMAMGRAIVTTDVPGCRETVEPGVNGYLVPAHESEDLAAAMNRFVDDPQLAARMGEQSLRMARERFDVRRVNAQMMNVMGLKEEVRR